MDTASHFIESGRVDYALVVDGEGSRHVIGETMKRMAHEGCTAEQFRAEFAGLTLGSGAAAMVLGRSDLAPQGHRYLRSVSEAATQWSHLCRGTTEGMLTDTKTLLSNISCQARHTKWNKISSNLFNIFIFFSVSL